MEKENYPVKAFITREHYRLSRSLSHHRQEKYYVETSEEKITAALERVKSERHPAPVGASLYLFHGAVIRDLEPLYNFTGIEVLHETQEGLVKVLNELGLPVKKNANKK